MNICINIYGQQRNLDNTIKTINQIIDNTNKFTILYTGWNHEEMLFEKYFPNSYVNRIEKNNKIIEEYKDKYNFIKIDQTNKHKSLEHIITGFFIKSKSINTINNYMKTNNIIFDLIITIRTDTIIYYNTKVNFNEVSSLSKVYICKERDFNHYKQGACNDVFVMSNYNNMVKILNQIEYLDKVTLNDNITFHPETSFYKYLNVVNKFNIFRLNLTVHVN